MTDARDETPGERLARWTAADAAIGLAAEAEQLRSQVADKTAEVEDLRARLAQLTTRIAQLEADNAQLRRVANRVSPVTLVRRVTGKVYRRVRSTIASRIRR